VLIRSRINTTMQVNMWSRDANGVGILWDDGYLPDRSRTRHATYAFTASGYALAPLRILN
jgi:hypothetical protein